MLRNRRWTSLQPSGHRWPKDSPMQIRLLYKLRGERDTHLSSRREGLSFHRRMSGIHPGSINHRLRHHATDTSVY